MEDLLPPGGAPGTIPSDLEQSTGLERFEILGKMQGIDVFDMKPLDASRLGTGIPLFWQKFGPCWCWSLGLLVRFWRPGLLEEKGRLYGR